MLKMKFSVLSVFCLLLSILLCGVYPALSDDEGKEDDDKKSVRDQIKEIFQKATALMQEGFKKAEKNAQSSWSALGDTAKKETEHSLQKMEELMETMKSQVEDAMKEGQDNFQKMMDKAREDSDNIQAKAEKTMKEETESMMDRAKTYFNI